MEYHLGINGKKKSPVMAAPWYQKAAEMGLAEAQAWLAKFYREGIGVESDLDLAFEWYHKAAEQGLGWAQYALGNLYGNSLKAYSSKEKMMKSYPRDEMNMKKWYNKAFAQGVRELPDWPEPLSPEAIERAKKH
jgi:TPR repeat protein